MYDHFEELLPQVRVLLTFFVLHIGQMRNSILQKKTSLGKAKTITER